MIICKFGGTSVASVSGANSIKSILNANKNRKIVVVSALGKTENEKKVTDQLYECFFIYLDNVEQAKVKFCNILQRYIDLANKLNVTIDFSKYKKQILQLFDSGKIEKDFLVSRGEFFCALLYAKYTTSIFLDATEYIIFNKNGKFNYKCTKNKINKLSNSKRYVIGGFYGATIDGKIKVFSRGGSDITGAIFAKALNAEVYENYTDVDGVFNKNPNVFEYEKKLNLLNYKTACQMADAGNEVVHKNALYMLKSSSTILQVKNTKGEGAFGTIFTHANLFFDDVYIAMANQTLLILSQINDDILQKIKHMAEVKNVLMQGNKFYVFLSEVYGDCDYFLHIKNVENVISVCRFSVFSNLIINKITLKKLKKIKKMAKKYAILAKFLSFKNNFVIVCNLCVKQKIVCIINNHLQNL